VTASTRTLGLDRVGFVVSLACAIHCAVMPIAVVAVPVLLSVAGIERSAEAVVVVIAIALASFSAWQQARTGRPTLALGFLAGAAVLVASRFVGQGRAAELVAVVGSLAVAFSHARALSVARYAAVSR
jgi:MerC mercury resistance protein